jgi:predicted nucleic acid-binding protein
VAVALFIPGIRTASVLVWFADCSDVIVSADWLVLEFASALSIKARRRDIRQRDMRAVWSEFQAFCETGLRLVPVSREAFTLAARLARASASGLRAGDSLHLAVALEIGALEMATADKVLESNARRHGLRTISFA